MNLVFFHKIICDFLLNLLSGIYLLFKKVLERRCFYSAYSSTLLYALILSQLFIPVLIGRHLCTFLEYP